MDEILEHLTRHRNPITAIFGIVIGLFSIAMIMSGDWGAVAQSLGNIIGAAIGAIGAAAAVVWQMRKQGIQNDRAVLETRIAALQDVAEDTHKVARCVEAAAKLISLGRIDGVNREISAMRPLHFEIREAYVERLRALAPIDEIYLDNFTTSVHRLQRLPETTWQITDAPSLADIEDCAAAIHHVAVHGHNFVAAMNGGLEPTGMASATMFNNAITSVEKLDGFEAVSRIRWMHR